MSSPRWELQSNRAQLSAGRFQADIVPGSPTEGLANLRWNGRPITPCTVLALRTPACNPDCPPLEDLYVRGDDLVAGYAKSSVGAVQPHIYWRAMQDPARIAAGVQLIISMQTDELDSQPESLVRSRLPASEVFVLDSVSEHVPERLDPAALPAEYTALAGDAACLFLFRLAEAGLSYVEMVHPGDFVSAHLEQTTTTEGAKQLTLVWTLFPESLEKGVIRRSRVAGWLLPSKNDLEHAAELFRQFVEAPLPLTA